MNLDLILLTMIDNLNNFYQSLPNEGRLIVYIIVILLFITAILLIIMIEQNKLNRKIVNKKIEENIDILDFNNEIDESNEKTRDLKEITDKIQAVIDNRAIDLTKFEQDQEENSIISYHELLKSVGKKEEKTEKEFDLSNLVRKIEVDEQVEEVSAYNQSIPIKEEPKFKSSALISPVFGIEEEKNNKENTVKEPLKYNNNLSEEELFLTNLINFRKNLE